LFASGKLVIGNGSTHDYIHRRTDVSVSLCIGDPVEELWLWPTFRSGNKLHRSWNKLRIDAPVSEPRTCHAAPSSRRKSENNC